MFRQLREEVGTALSVALSSLDLLTDDLGVEEPLEDVPATFASSATFRLAGVVDAPPPKTAANIAEKLSVEGYDYLIAVDTQGPYVSLHISDAYYDDTLDAAVSDEAYGRLPATGDSVVVEHTNANPIEPVHVGRTRNPATGDAAINPLDFADNNVDRHYYVNDAGRQMVAFTWAYETFNEDDLESEPARGRVEHDLVCYYRKGNAFLEETDPEEVEQAEVEITEILQGIEGGDEETHARVETMVDQVLGGMRECLERFPVEFDKLAKETRFMLDGDIRDLAERLKEVDHAVYEEDVWQLEFDDYGFEKNPVSFRSDGTSLYATRGLARREWKFDNYDRAVTVPGEDHKLQSGQLRIALDILGNDVDRLENVIYSWVNLPGGETMFTRKGTGVMFDDLLNEAIDRVRDEVEARLEGRARDDDLDEAGIDRIARQVGTGAVRYDIVSKQPTKTTTFEWGQVLNFEVQPASYIQYVHARCCGIADEAATVGLDASETDPAVLTTDVERDLLVTITRFSAVVEIAANDLEPYAVATFTRELAEVSNTFCRECLVLDADEGVGVAQLALTEVSWSTVANAFAIVGVEVPESMWPRVNRVSR